jgi:tripartite-type tricarboxylate transporter receptor subunit TctC
LASFSFPTFAEQGVNNIDVVFWFGVLAPAGTPNAIVEKLNSAIAASVKDEPEVRQRFLDEGMDIAVGPPGDFSDAIVSGAAQWRSLVNSLGLRQ